MLKVDDWEDGVGDLLRSERWEPDCIRWRKVVVGAEGPARGGERGA